MKQIITTIPERASLEYFPAKYPENWSIMAVTKPAEGGETLLISPLRDSFVRLFADITLNRDKLCVNSDDEEHDEEENRPDRSQGHQRNGLGVHNKSQAWTWNGCTRILS